MLKSWTRACKAVLGEDATIPRAYDLRHSFATEMYRQTGDPKATAELLMHSPSSQMMDRYTIGGVSARLKLAVGAFNATVSRKRLAESAGSRREKRKRA
jgi:integrase